VTLVLASTGVCAREEEVALVEQQRLRFHRDSGAHRVVDVCEKPNLAQVRLVQEEAQLGLQPRRQLANHLVLRLPPVHHVDKVQVAPHSHAQLLRHMVTRGEIVERGERVCALFR